MTREEAIKRLKESRNTIQPFLYVDEAIDYAVKALEKEPCEDAVSRKQAIDFVDEVIGGKNDFADAIRDGVVAVLSALPSVTPTRKKGKWIIDGHHRRCPKCNEYFCIKDSEGDEIPNSFCPNCGEEMENEEE